MHLRFLFSRLLYLSVFLLPVIVASIFSGSKTRGYSDSCNSYAETCESRNLQSTLVVMMSNPDLQEIRKIYQEADKLCSAEQVDEAITKMSQEITERLEDSNPLALCVMNGGLIFSGKLLAQLDFPLQLGYLHATRYGNETVGTELDWKVRPLVDFKDRTLLILDDILDEGHTLAAIIDYCKEAGAKEVLTAVLVNKVHDRKAREDLKGDFVGLDVEDRFIFGAGMDYQGYWRNAPGIFAVKGL